MVRRRLVALLFVLGAGAVCFAWFWPQEEPRGAGAAPAAPPPPAARFADIPPRAPIGEPRGDAFAPRQWTTEAPPQAAQQVKPPPQPMPYRYAGKVVHDGVEQLLLARGDTVLPVRAGETLEGGYRVESIDGEWIVLRHLPLGTQHRIPVGSMLENEGQR